MNQAENEGKPSEKILSKEKVAVYMNTIKEKSSIYCRTACTKTTELWNSGTKGKAICIGAAFCVLLIGWLVFRDSSKPESGNVEKTDDMETTLQTLANAHRQSELPQKASGDDAVPNANATPQPYVQDVSNDESEVAKVGAMALAEIAAAVENEKEFTRIADAYISAGEVWGQTLHFTPENKVSYDEFVKGYYLIDDALTPKFAKLLTTVRFPLGISQGIMRDLMPRAEHLLYYCSKTGLSDNSNKKERLFHLQMIYLARLFQLTMAQYALAFGQDNREMLKEAEEMLAQCIRIKKLLPPHSTAKDAEEKYAALPYPPRPIDLIDAAKQVERDVNELEEFLYRVRSKGEDKIQGYMENEKKNWLPVEIGNFRIKSFCGLTFGQTLADCEKLLGEPVFQWFNGECGIHAFLMKKPFRKFTRACLVFGNESSENSKGKSHEKELQGLRSIRLEADIPGDVSYQSCLDELKKVKKLLEEKFKLDLGIGRAGDESDGPNYWYGIGLSDSGWIVLGIRCVKDHASSSYDNSAKNYTDGPKTLVLEIRCADREGMKKIASECREKLDAERAAQSESQKKALDVSDDLGADVL